MKNAGLRDPEAIEQALADGREASDFIRNVSAPLLLLGFDPAGRSRTELSC